MSVVRRSLHERPSGIGIPADDGTPYEADACKTATPGLAVALVETSEYEDADWLLKPSHGEASAMITATVGSAFIRTR
jgi:hypothetical protein